jgi:hypothetical protein
MKRLAKWSGLVAMVMTGVVVGLRVVAAVRQRVDRRLAQMERIAEDARQALEKTADAMHHTEEALRDTRRTIS